MLHPDRLDHPTVIAHPETYLDHGLAIFSNYPSEQ